MAIIAGRAQTQTPCLFSRGRVVVKFRPMCSCPTRTSRSELMRPRWPGGRADGSSSRRRTNAVFLDAE